MLSKITIQNFALIQHLSVSLENGLQVITGETGAGKSIILGALRLILGERADSKSISDPEKKSVVEAEFKITSSYLPFFEENDLDFEENTIIRREILPSGKSRAFINDIPVTLDVLKELSSKLIDIHSQFETSNLFSEEYQFKIIDGLSENKEVISDYQKKFVSYQNLKKELLSLENQLAERNKESDYQSFLLSELQEFNLDNINLEELKNKVNIGEYAELILENLGQISGRFQQEEMGILDSLNDIRNKIQKISENSPHLEQLSQRIEESYLELKDIADSIENEIESTEINPEELAVFTSQFNKINSLLLKHQVSDIEELTNFLYDNKDLQVMFIFKRLEASLEKMLAVSNDRENVRKQFYRVASSPNGLYPLIDYVNFKGEGINPNERYNGQGWGLLQVLENMKGTATGQSALVEFSNSAKDILARRVKNAPRNESRWLQGWYNRVDTYKTFEIGSAY